MSAWLIIGIAALVFLLICVIAAVLCLRQVVKPVRYSVAETRESDIKGGFGEAVESYEERWSRKPFTLEAEGAVISGELIENPMCPENAPRAVIVCHGHTVNRYCSLKYADIFYRAGYHIVLYDERYFGESTGEICTLGQNEVKDLALVIQYTRRYFGDGCVIGLHGESMGAATALLSLAYENTDFIVADCPFADTELLMQELIVSKLHMRTKLLMPFVKFLAKLIYSYDIASVSPIKAVEASDTPICFMHGSGDRLIDCNHSKMMYEAARNPKSVLNLFDGADHAMSIVSDRESYEKLLLEFLDAVDAR